MEIKKSTISIGGLALLAGIVASLVTALAVSASRNKSSRPVAGECEGWEDELGI